MRTAGKIYIALPVSTVMRRYNIVNALLTATQGTTYLEIGVETGKSFLFTRAQKKIAVDPAFQQPIRTIRRFDELVGVQRRRYHEVPSDKFFADYESAYRGIEIDVAFIDGLHTHEQTMRDVEQLFKTSFSKRISCPT